MPHSLTKIHIFRLEERQNYNGAQIGQALGCSVFLQAYIPPANNRQAPRKIATQKNRANHRGEKIIFNEQFGFRKKYPTIEPIHCVC